MNVGVEYNNISNSFQFKGAGAQVKLIHMFRFIVGLSAMNVEAS